MKRPRTFKKGEGQVKKRARRISSAAMVRKVIAETGEMKFKDFTKASVAMSATWTGGEIDPATILSISGVAQGDGEETRDGRVYEIHSVHVNGFCLMPAILNNGAAPGEAVARIALVLDTQTNGAQLNAEDVYDAGATVDVQSFRNLQFSKRFKVLKNIVLRLDRGTMSTNFDANTFNGGQVMVPWTINKKFGKALRVRTSGTTENIGDIVDNSLHLIGCFSGANPDTVNVAYEARVRFTS